MAATSTAPTAEKIYAELLTSLQVPRDKLRAIATHMYSEFVRGLQADGHSIKMIPSYISLLPSGQETGTYLAIDLGGTNFRVCAIHLKGNGQLDVDADKFTVEDDVKQGSGDILFDFIAHCVQKFIEKRKQQLDVSSVLELGFTFSFPVSQSSFSSGNILNWTKGFDSSDTLGKDAVQLLQNALTRLGLKIKVVALVNDTVGTLVAHSYKSPTTVMGVIFGTGTNAAYIEQLDQIVKFNAKVTPSMIQSGRMLINSEWGGFDCEKLVLPLTHIDEALDKASTNRGEQLFEKLISGMYLGEITGRALLYLTESGALFGGKVTNEMSKPHTFETAFMSAIEADMSPNLATVSDILTTHCALPSVSLTDRQLVKSLVQQIGTRAARLSAVGVFSLLEKMSVPKNNTPVVVAIDGSVWLKYPGFPERLQAALNELMGPEKAALVSLETACDGSGSGAGLLAALAPLNND